MTLKLFGYCCVRSVILIVGTSDILRGILIYFYSWDYSWMTYWLGLFGFWEWIFYLIGEFPFFVNVEWSWLLSADWPLSSNNSDDLLSFPTKPFEVTFFSIIFDFLVSLLTCVCLILASDPGGNDGLWTYTTSYEFVYLNLFYCCGLSIFKLSIYWRVFYLVGAWSPF